MKQVTDDLLDSCRKEIILAYRRAKLRASKFSHTDESEEGIEARVRCENLKDLAEQLGYVCKPTDDVPNYRPWGGCPKGLEVAMGHSLRKIRVHPKHPARGLSDRQWTVLCNVLNTALNEMLRDYNSRLFWESVNLLDETPA